MAIWELSFTVPARLVPVFEMALEPLGGALAVGESEGTDLRRMQLYLGENPGEAAITTQMAVGALAAGVDLPAYTWAMMPETDWVAASQANLPAVRAGRFWIYGSHITGRPPAGTEPLLIDASIAFGTGHHETTAGCLQAIEYLARRGLLVRDCLDMGCGTGVLGFAVAKVWRQARISAADNDRDSVKVTRANARLNGVAANVRALRSDGYRHAGVAAGAPYDLIVANILAGPLCAMATEAAAHLAPGGRIVLSGLLNRQERRVIARHRAVGLLLERRWRINGWSALLLRKG